MRERGVGRATRTWQRTTLILSCRDTRLLRLQDSEHPEVPMVSQVPQSEGTPVQGPSALYQEHRQLPTTTVHD